MDKMVPKVRFKGFSDDWEQQPLKDIAKFSKGHGYSKGDLKSSGVPIILYGRLYTNYRSQIKKVNTFVDKRESSILSNGNEVIVPSSGETAEDISRASVVKKPNIILGGDLNIIIPNIQIDSLFLALTISNGNQKKELSRRAQGKSIVHLRNSDLKNVALIHPSKIEQIKIGKLFEKIESLTTLQQRQLDNYKKLKQGLLQKLFPSDGEKVPVLRFADFHEDWEQRKLGSVSEIVGGGTPSTSVESYWNGSINWYSPNEIGNSIYVSKSQKAITNLGLKKSSAKILPSGSLLFTSRAGIGNTAILSTKGTTNQGFQSIVPHKGQLDTYFIYSKTNKLKEYGQKMGAGSTFIEVSGKQMEKMLLNLPSIKEQKKIGDFIKLIDFNITLQQEKLKDLQQLKKFYLQNLFI